MGVTYMVGDPKVGEFKVTVEERVVGPQPGPQTQFMACRADIGIYGGGVFGGKTWALTMLPLKHIETPGFSAVTFRRTGPDIRNPGSLWDESMKWYPDAGGRPRESLLEWEWPNNVMIKMDGLQYDSDALSWKSAQIALIQFDQLEEFSEYQFWYMQSRNRTSCGVKAYTRAGCNPLADTWLAELLRWWWDPLTGYAIEERSGLARWFIRVRDEIVWSDVQWPCDSDEASWNAAEERAKASLAETYGPQAAQYARSLAFIRAHMRDNLIGMSLDPGYESRIRSLSYVEQERLLGGNWLIRAAAGLVFDRGWWALEGRIVPAAPRAVKARVRYWDKAGTAGAGDWTVGILMSLGLDGITYIEDEIRGQWGAGEREGLIKQAAKNDPPGTHVAVEQEPGSGGKDSAMSTIANLAGFPVFADRPSGDLVERAQPLAAQAQVGNVRLVRGPWNEGWLREHHAFPTKGVNDDRVAASSGAFKILHRLPSQTASYTPARIRV